MNKLYALMIVFIGIFFSALSYADPFSDEPVDSFSSPENVLPNSDGVMQPVPGPMASLNQQNPGALNDDISADTATGDDDF